MHLRQRSCEWDTACTQHTASLRAMSLLGSRTPYRRSGPQHSARKQGKNVSTNARRRRALTGARIEILVCWQIGALIAVEYAIAQHTPVARAVHNQIAIGR